MTRMLVLSALVLVAGCGGDDGPPPPDTRDIALRLADLPGVTVTEKPPVHAPMGYRYFVLQVTQPVDHGDPHGATFEQEVSLIHRDVTAPMVLFTTGYEDYNLERASEPTELLSANQISIEYRYFGTSRPVPTDWTKLTISQMADDEHAIVKLLGPIYTAAWISTGESKGGMTATYHRRFYPDDVAGTIAYVAPLSFSIPDQRYATYLAGIGPPTCAAAVRAAAKEMLQNRRAALLTRAQAQATAAQDAYTRIAIGPALESAIQDLEWTYWQYYGEGFCGQVPAVTSTDDAMFEFLDFISPVTFSDDVETASFEPYFYQAYAQLGSPGTASIRGDLASSDLAPFVQYTEADFAGTLPVGVPIPTFDASAMADIDDWVQHAASGLVFVYGEWDPWTGGAYRLGGADDALELTVSHGTHGAHLTELPVATRDGAFGKLAAWTGVTPVAPVSPRSLTVDPRSRLRHRGPQR